jgi:hypothetical protein
MFYCGRLRGMTILEYSEYKEMNEPRRRIIRRLPRVLTFVKSTKTYYIQDTVQLLVSWHNR